MIYSTRFLRFLLLGLLVLGCTTRTWAASDVDDDTDTASDAKDTKGGKDTASTKGGKDAASTTEEDSGEKSWMVGAPAFSIGLFRSGPKFASAGADPLRFPG